MMNTEDLSFVADALLALVGEDPANPFDFYLVPRPRPMTPSKISAFVHLASNRRPADVLLEDECGEILKQAKLTANQAEVLDLRLNGVSFDEIGLRRGATRQGAMRTFLHAVKKIGRVIRVYPYKGLSDVYRHEIRRGLSNGAFGRMTR
jgi:hypothetical protein